MLHCDQAGLLIKPLEHPISKGGRSWPSKRCKFAKLGYIPPCDRSGLICHLLATRLERGCFPFFFSLTLSLDPVSTCCADNLATVLRSWCVLVFSATSPPSDAWTPINQSFSLGETTWAWPKLCELSVWATPRQRVR